MDYKKKSDIKKINSSDEDSSVHAAPKKNTKSSVADLVQDEDFSSVDDADERDEIESYIFKTIFMIRYKPMKVSGKIQHSEIDSSKVELFLIRAPVELPLSKLNGMKLTIDEEPFADGTVGRFNIGENHFYVSQEPLADVKNTLNFFPNEDDEKLELGKPFSRHLKINEAFLTKVAKSGAESTTASSNKKRPEFFVRFAPPGAVLPKKLVLQKKSEIETGWKVPDATPYVTSELKDKASQLQSAYEATTGKVKAKEAKVELKKEADKKKRKHEESDDSDDGSKKKKHKK